MSIAARPEADRQEMVRAVQAATDWSLWLAMRLQHGASKEQTAAVVRRLTLGLLAAPAK